MELSRTHYKENNRAQEQLAVYDLVGELLAITLEKHDVEVVIDPKGFLMDQLGGIRDSSTFQTIIDCEEVLEEDSVLRITLSGGVQKGQGILDSFMLDFSIIWDQSCGILEERVKSKGTGLNTLWLQFGRKAEQFTDTLFKINLYHKNMTGKKSTLGHGEGFLVFDKEQTSCLH